MRVAAAIILCLFGAPAGSVAQSLPEPATVAADLERLLIYGTPGVTDFAMSFSWDPSAPCVATYVQERALEASRLETRATVHFGLLELGTVRVTAFPGGIERVTVRPNIPDYNVTTTLVLHDADQNLAREFAAGTGQVCESDRCEGDVERNGIDLFLPPETEDGPSRDFLNSALFVYAQVCRDDAAIQG